MWVQLYIARRLGEEHINPEVRCLRASCASVRDFCRVFACELRAGWALKLQSAGHHDFGFKSASGGNATRGPRSVSATSTKGRV